MEAYNIPTQDSRVFVMYAKTRSWISAFLGIIITVLGFLVVFVVASMEGTKEIRASGSDSAKMLHEWRLENNGETGTFPEERSRIFDYKGREYYFVIETTDVNGDVLDWYFAYDGGIDYILSSYRYYVLTGLALVIALYVAHINYVATIRQGMNTESFAKTLAHYQKTKEKVARHTQLIPRFCIYKNKQAIELMKRDIVEEAGINYADYQYSSLNLEKWQKRVVRKIKKIKITKLHSSDLLQEHGRTNTRTTFLPLSQQQHQRRFMLFGGFQRLITSMLSGLVVAFGVLFGNIALGLTYGLTILLSFVSAVIVAADHVTTTLRNRYIAKADLLNEFDNIKDLMVEQEEAERLESDLRKRK